MTTPKTEFERIGMAGTWKTKLQTINRADEKSLELLMVVADKDIAEIEMLATTILIEEPMITSTVVAEANTPKARAYTKIMMTHTLT